MSSIYSAEFGIGNITGTRYFLGDMSKEGKDALIRINQARNKWEKAHIKTQRAYGAIGDNVPSVTTVPKNNRFGSSQRRINSVVGLGELQTHDTMHSLPIALGMPGQGIGPTNRGEQLVDLLEPIVNSQAPVIRSTGLRGYQGTIPFKPQVTPLSRTMKSLERVPITSGKGKVLSEKTNQAGESYVTSVLDKLEEEPGMLEALSAHNYLGARRYSIDKEINRAGKVPGIREKRANTPRRKTINNIMSS
jgi:hypothetical protein